MVKLTKQPTADVTAFVLAGGKSTRMGSDKAAILWEGTTLLERMLALLREVTGAVRTVGSAEKFRAFGDAVEDIFPGQGPLGGIHAALTSSKTDLNLVVAVDMPFLESPFLEYLVSAARQSDAIATVPRTDGRWQPLCAVYRREFAEHAERSLRDGKNKIDALFSVIKARTLEDDELKEAGFSAEMFRNLNTREDLRMAAERSRQ